jgi:hypothetical protein
MGRQRTPFGRVEWTALLALAGMVIALAAVTMAALAVWQVRQGAERSAFTAGLESLWHLEAHWQSPGMLATRQGAAAALLDGSPTEEVDELLDFFELVAGLVDRRVLDEEMLWQELAWPILNYWTASEEYIRKVRHDEPTMWQSAEGMVNRLLAIEARKRRRSLNDVRPSQDEVQDFLTDERGEADAPECPVTASRHDPRRADA